MVDFEPESASLSNSVTRPLPLTRARWRSAGLGRIRPRPTRARRARNPEPGGLVDLKDLEGPRSCRRATCGAPHRRPADTRPGVPSESRAARRLRRPGRSSSRRLRCCRVPQGGASSPPRSTAAPETRRGAACGGDDDSSSGAGSWEERPGLLQARADGARRGALSGGGVRHMLMQILPLGDLVRQVIWGLCRAASRGAPGRRTSGAKSKYSEIPPAFV